MENNARITNYYWGFFLIFVVTLLPQIAYAVDFAAPPGGCYDPKAFEAQCSTEVDDGLFSAIACRVMKTFSAGILPLYCHIMASSEMQGMLNALMSLYLVFWGLSYVMGIAQVSTGDSIIRLLKVALIFTFVANTEVFFGFVYKTVMDTPLSIIEAVTLAVSGSESFYSHVDKGIGEIFNDMIQPEASVDDISGKQRVMFKVFTFALAVQHLFPGGQYISGIYVTTIFGWVATYFTIMIRYLLAILALLFLLMLAPLFLPTLLFSQTRYIADEWLKMVISFITQMVLIVIYVLMVEEFFVEFMDMIRATLEADSDLKSAYSEHLTRYSDPEAEGGKEVIGVDRTFGPNKQTAEEYLQSMGIEPGDDFIPSLVFNMIMMMIIVWMSYKFMTKVPAFSGFLAGNPKFVRLMGGSNWGQAGSSAELAFQRSGQKAFNKFSHESRLGRIIDSSSDNLSTTLR